MNLFLTSCFWSVFYQNRKNNNKQNNTPSNQTTHTKSLMENFIKAAQNLGYTKLAAAGGVSANILLRRKLLEECEKRGWQAYIPDLSLCGDNAAMVGAQAYYEYQKGNVATMSLNAVATLNIDTLT